MSESQGGHEASSHGRMFQLDGLRGIAAFVIMFYHAQIVFRADLPFSRGYLFVDLFFLLSGFVLAVSTERKLDAGIGALSFTWSRYKRLFPLVAVGIFVALVRALAIGLADPLTLAMWVALDLAMIPALTGAGPFYRLNGPQWTLFWELAANFVHALFLRRVPTIWLLPLAAMFAGLLIYTVSLHGSDTLGVDALTWKTWWMPIPRIAFPYVLGVWFGRQYRAGKRTRAPAWWICLAFPVAAVIALPSLPLGRAAGDLVFVIAILPPALWLVAMSTLPDRLARPMGWLGDFSLPLYCVHLTVLVALSELLGRDIWVLTLAILLALLVTYVFSRLVSFKAKPTPHKGAVPAQ